MLWVAAPLSLHPVKTYCVPVGPAWGVFTEMECVPCERFMVTGEACAVPPSIDTSKPAGEVVTVIGTPAGPWLTVKVCPPTLMVALRALLPVLAATE